MMRQRLGRQLLLHVGRKAAAAFSPTDIAGLTAWYDFSDITTLFKDSARTTPVTADGDVIGGVTDKSTAGKHLTQATTANKPVYKVNIKNGLSVAQSADATDSLPLNAAHSLTDFTVYWVARATFSGSRIILGNTGSNVYGLQIQILAASELSFRNAAGIVQVTTNGYVIDSYWLGAGRRASNALTGRRNGADVTTGTPTNTGAYLANSVFGDIGGSRSLQGQWCELLVFNAALSAGDITSMETYLNDKWAIY